MNDLPQTEPTPEEMEELQQLINKVTTDQQKLNQMGMNVETVHGKINATLNMLLEEGILTHYQIFKMEKKFTETIAQEMAQALAHVEAQVGKKLLDSQKLIVPPNARKLHG